MQQEQRLSNNPAEWPLMLTRAEVLEVTRMCLATFNRLKAAGKGPKARAGVGHARYLRDDVVQWIKNLPAQS
jgi:hypothetical protein